MTTRRSTPNAVAVVAVSIVSLLLPGFLVADESAASIVAYQTNLESLTQFKCRFTVTLARGADVAAALAGNYTNVRKCEYHLVVRRDMRKLVSTSPVDTSPPKKLKDEENKGSRIKVKTYTVDFIPIADIRFGNDWLSFYEPWQKASMIAKDENGREWHRTPLNMVGWDDPFSPADSLRRSLKGELSISSAGEQVVREAPTTEVHVKSAEWGRRNWSFSPTQGYLPIRVRDFFISPKGQPYDETQTHVMKAKKVKGDRWFPMHIVRIALGKDPSQPVAIVDVSVTDLEFDKVVDDDLAIDLPAGTSIEWLHFEKHNEEHFKLRRNEKIGPKDIPRLQKMLQDSRTNPKMDTAVLDAPTSRWRIWLPTAGGIGLFAAALVCYRRFRPRSS